MRKSVLVLAIAACCSCRSGGPGFQGRTEPVGPRAALVNRVWARSDSTGLPGVIRIFLDDGTLVMDSCWETYQLAKWRAESDSVVTWQEGTAEVRATLVKSSGEELVLRVALVDGSQDEHYRAASVPYLCPDMKR